MKSIDRYFFENEFLKEISQVYPDVKFHFEGWEDDDLKSKRKYLYLYENQNNNVYLVGECSYGYLDYVKILKSQDNDMNKFYENFPNAKTAVIRAIQNYLMLEFQKISNY